MNNRILTALFALALCLCLFIGVVPAEADAACAHSACETINQKPATCTEPGVKLTYYRCYNCGKTFTDTAHKNEINANNLVEPAKGHKWTTEQDANYHWEKCTNSGCTEIQNKTGHTPGEWITTSSGHTRECTVCHRPLTEAEHDFAKRANDDGKTHSEVCKDCGYAKTEKIAHTITGKNNGDGTHDASCNYCDYKATVAHVDNNSNCSCDDCDATLHTFDAYVIHSSKVKHIKVCSECSERAPGAVWEDCKFVYTPSTVEGNKATHIRKCEICGNDSTKVYCSDGNHDCICDDCGGPMFHDWSATATYVGTPAKSAKCEEDGNVAYGQCKNCQKYFLPSGQIVTKEETVIEALGHDWNDTISKNGKYHFYECKRLDSYGSPICDALKDKEEHVFDKYVIKQDGTHIPVCSVCDKKAAAEEHADIPGDGKCECKCGYVFPHKYNSNYPNVVLVEAKANTCTEDGNIAYFHCEECGGNFKGGSDVLTPISDVVVKASGHKLVVNATRGNLHDVTCAQVNKVQKSDGKYATYRCDYAAYVPHQDTNGDCKCDLADAQGNICGADLHTHSYKVMPAVEATCTTEGFEAYYYYAPCGRMFSDDTYTQEISARVSTGYADCEPGAWVNEGDNHVKHCENCNKVVDSGAHVDANGDNRCDVCNFELALEYVAEVPATCTTSGTKAHYISRVTQRKYWDAEGTKYISESDVGNLVIRAYAHIDPVTGVGPTVKDKGNGTHEYTCQLCNKVTKTEAHTTGGCFCTVCGAGASKDHVATIYPYQAPVCDKEGHEAYAKCSCGQYYNAAGEKVSGYSAVKLRTTGHKWGAEFFNDDAAGEHYIVCSVCGGKSYSEHEMTVKDPLSGNYHEFICECGKVKTEVHYDRNGDKVCDVKGCEHDLSGKQVTVNNNPSTTVVTGDKNTVNNRWSWLKNWLNNTKPSTAGGSEKPEQAAKPDGAGTGSPSGNTVVPPSSGSTTTPATGSNTGSTGAGSSNAGSSTQGGSQTAEATGVLQVFVSFLNWVFSGFGG